MSRVREATPTSRRVSFEVAATTARSVEREKAEEFSRLNHAGQQAYASMRTEGMDHDSAFREARISHGTRRTT